MTLTSGGTITELPGVVITAATLTGSSSGAASFAQPGNLMTNLGAFSTNNSDFAITAQNLVARTQLDGGAAITLTSPVNAVPGNVTLSALNAAGTAPAGGSISFFDAPGSRSRRSPWRGRRPGDGVNTTATAMLRAGGRSRRRA